YLLFGIGFGLTGVAPTATLLGATVVVWTLAEIIGAPVASAYVSERAPRHMLGRYQGAWNMTFAFGFAAGPASGAAGFGWNPAVMWGACFFFNLAAAALVATLPRASGANPRD